MNSVISKITYKIFIMNPFTTEIKNKLMQETIEMNGNINNAKVVVHLKNDYEDIYLFGMDEQENRYFAIRENEWNKNREMGAHPFENFFDNQLIEIPMDRPFFAKIYSETGEKKYLDEEKKNYTRKFKIDTINDNSFIIVIRLIEIEEIGSENFKSIISKDSDPEFVGVEPNSINYQNFKKISNNNQVICLDLDKDFSYLIKSITDDNIRRQIKLYQPLSQEVNLTIDFDLSDFFNRNTDSNNIPKECPNCKDIYLEEFETCEYCGYTRYI